MAHIKLAVVGYGNMARNSYMPILHSVCDTIQLAALVEPDSAAVRDAATTYSFQNTYDDVGTMLADMVPDAAMVLVPAQYHYDVIFPLLEAGVDVYTEKPDTPKLDDARELVALAEKNNCIYQVGQNRLFMECLQRAENFFTDTPIDFAHVEKSKSYPNTSPEYLFDDGIHVVSPLLWMTGGVEEVLSARVVPDRLLSAHFGLSSGGAATLTMHSDAGYWVERFLLHGQEKSANVITPDIAELHEDGMQMGDQHVGRNATLFRPATLMGFQGAVEHFLECCESRQEPIGSARSLLQVHELMNEVFRKAGLQEL
ncbi:MAG: Gfo/Idh/MocA family oxidoreductase [Armatimonadota bacterium]